MIEDTLKNLKFPIEITMAKIYRDGGTVGIALKDAVGTEEEFCLDGSISRNTRNQFYWGTFHPGKKPGQLIARGSTAEASIISILKRIISQWYSEAEQKELTGTYGKRAILDEERKTALCLDVIERVRQALE